jgi:hypothetical protein
LANVGDSAEQPTAELVKNNQRKILPISDPKMQVNLRFIIVAIIYKIKWTKNINLKRHHRSDSNN